jgi:hypothetical protein
MILKSADNRYLIKANPFQFRLMMDSYRVYNRIENGDLKSITEIVIPKINPTGFEIELQDLTEDFGPFLKVPRSLYVVKDGEMKCNEKNLRILSNSCDTISRIKMCQFDNIANIVTLKDPRDFVKFHRFKSHLDGLKRYWNLSMSANFGIFSHEIDNTARTLWDMHQVIRNRLAYDSSPVRKVLVDFDEPFCSDGINPLIKVIKIDN